MMYGRRHFRGFRAGALMAEEHHQRLIIDVVRLLAAGKISPHNTLPALKALTDSESKPIPFEHLLAAIREMGGPEASRLAADLKGCRLRDAARYYTQRLTDTVDYSVFNLTLAGVPRHAPTGWTSPGDAADSLREAARIARDRRHIMSFRDAVPEATSLLESHYRDCQQLNAEAVQRFGVPVIQAFRRRAEVSDGRAIEPVLLAKLVDIAEKLSHEHAPSFAAEAISQRYQRAETPGERRTQLDALCCFPAIEAAKCIQNSVRNPVDQERAELILACRFGPRAAPGWAGLSNWLARCERQRLEELTALQRVFQQDAGEFALLWLRGMPTPDQRLVEAVETWCDDNAVAVESQELLQHYGAAIPADEWNILTASSARPVDVPTETPITLVPAELVDDAVEQPQATTIHRKKTKIPPPRPVARPVSPPPTPAVPAGPSLWNDHIQPFLTEQWYLAAGIMMVLAGSSLLTYYTWDKHWAIRYTLMPSMLGLFTWALAWLGSWVEQRDAEFQPTAAILRGAAIGLLPVNFMAVAVLSNDPQVAHKALIVPVMAVVYLSLFGYGLSKWCAAVNEQFKWLLGGTLLGLNSLVMIGPLARTVASMADNALYLVLGAGFYLGFAAVAFATVRFSRDILTASMAKDQRVPWFFGGTLIVTFVQVMLWVHGYMKHAPDVSTYAAMVILSGGLVLFVERRAQDLSDSPASYRGESFMGFALVLMGVLMGVSQPYVRILVFLLAGAIWLTHGRANRETLQDWIGLTLVTLGGASIGVLDAFPREFLPALGLALAVAMGGAARLLNSPRNVGIRDTCRDMQAAILMLTTVVAVLVQWDLQSPPLRTGAWLLLIVAGFFWRAWYDGKLRWVHTAMTVVAIALPYLGCINFEEKTLQGNVIPFGLSVLSLSWLGLNWWATKLLANPSGHFANAENNPSTATSEPGVDGAVDPASSGTVPKTSFWQLIRDARSTVIWVYGAIAVAAMVLRVLVESDTGQVTRLHMLMDYSGPLLMAGVLALGTWYSRSLIPAAMAGVIVIILFPEIRATFAKQFEMLGWGSGLGGAASGLGLLLLAFLVRPARFLQSVGEGDRFMNRILFPLRRYDHTLFTWPLLGAALFLTIRTDSVTLVRNLLAGMELRSAVAVLVTSATWTMLAAYYRRVQTAVVATYLGCGWLITAIALLYHVQAPSTHWMWPALMSGVALQLLYLGYRFIGVVGEDGSRPSPVDQSTRDSATIWSRMIASGSDRSWVQSILASPTRHVLNGGTLFLTVVCIFRLIVGESPGDLILLLAFLAVQLCWHGLRTDQPAHGMLLFVLAWTTVLSWTAPGAEHLLQRVSFDASLIPTLLLLLSVQLAVTALEFAPAVYERIKVVIGPVQYLGSWLSVVLVGCGILEALTGLTPKAVIGADYLWPLAAVAGVGLLTARSQSSLALTVFVLLLGYTLVHTDILTAMGVDTLAAMARRTNAFLSPWRLSAFAVLLAVLQTVGSRLYAVLPRLLRGSFSQIPFPCTNRHWLILPGLGFAFMAAALHTAVPNYRESTIQLLAPFLAALTWGICGWSTSRTRYYIGAGMLVALGNIHVVRIYLGDMLRPYGIFEIQLVCLGLAVTLVELTVIRIIARNDVVTRSFNRASLVLAGLVMALIAANYFVHPDLSTISWQRFAMSGAMAWLAGMYFRRAARRPMPGEEPYVNTAEGMHHLGITIAVWCGVLTLPALRAPSVVLFSLGVPLAWFWLRAEFGIRSGKPQGAAYRNSATVLGFVVLFAYVFRFAFQMILFPPDDLITATASLTDLLHTDYYHSSAPFIALVSLVLLRLHGLGGTSWLALYGGLGLVVSSFFTLTWLPGLSPFDAPVASAWCAIGLAHFWALVSDQRSPLRTAIERVAAIDAQHWFELRHAWGICTLVATHVVVAWGLTDWKSHSLAMAPLLAGLSSVVIHQAVIRRSALYCAVAAAELLVALHADFVVDSYIDRKSIIWVIIGAWTAVMTAQFVLTTLQKIKPIANIGTVAAGFAALGLAHVLYHHPWSTVGLWAFAAGAVLAAVTPRRTRYPSSGEDRLAAGLLVAVPAWLVLFSQAGFEVEGALALTHSWPLLITTLTILLTGAFAAFFQTTLVTEYDRLGRPQPQLLDQTLHWFAVDGTLINSCTLGFSFVATVVAQVAHHGRPFGNVELGTVLVLYAAMTYLWFQEGRLRQNMASYILLQLSVLGFFAVIRRQLMLTTDFWTPQYDVWASLVVSGMLTGVKQQFDTCPKEQRIPLLGTLLTLPVVALIWVMWNDLGTDVAMLVVGLHSLMFSFMGKDQRESPYNLVATCGFVAFVVMLFWSKLELRVLHAFTVPVGIGVLAMLHLLRDRVNLETRNRVRLVTLLVMIGSVGYYALLDTRYPIAFHVTMLAICLAAMGFGSLLRIRLYLLIGFAGLMVDLASIMYRVIAGIEERGTQMTIIGSLVLLAGVGLVLGAILFKTHRDEINSRIDQWKQTMGGWQ
jgi:hypothetical protein